MSLSSVARAAAERFRVHPSVATFAIVMFAVGGAALATSAGLAWRHAQASRTVVDDAMRHAKADTGHAAADVDKLLRAVMPLAQAAAEDLGRDRQTDQEIDDRLSVLAGADRSVLGMGAAYEPFAFDRRRRLYAPYIVTDGGRTRRRVQIDERYDYTKFQYRWYGDPLLDGAEWSEPIDGPAGAGTIVMYSTPFYRRGADPVKEAPIGVTFATVSVDTIARVLNELDLGTSGYAFIFSSQGHYVAHPHRDLVTRGITVFETAFNSGDTTLHSLAIHALKGEGGLVESIDPGTGQASWVVYEPIKSTGWTLAVVYYQDAFRLNPERQRRDYFRVTAAAVAGAGLIGLALFAVLAGGGTRWLWAVAISVSVVMAAGIVALWSVATRYPSLDTSDRTKVLDVASVDQYLGAYERDTSTRLERIPTGVFVKSAEFLSSTNVAVTGYVWQRLPAPAPDKPDFILPDADKPDIKPMSRHREGNDDVLLWSFAANFREQFAYDKYPFDQQDIWVRLRPAALERNVVLTPDLADYAVSNPAARPGVAADLVLPGWELTGSYFDYRTPRYNANFGFATFDPVTAPPELYFDVTARRSFLGPFVSNIVPLAVAGVMIFSLLLISSKHDQLSKFAGFTAKDIVKGSAAVFFVISFQHIALRNNLASPRLIYFEYFYFTTYLGMLIVTLNGILFASGSGGPVVEFRDNLVPKIAFWPTAMSCLFVVTLWAFY